MYHGVKGSNHFQRAVTKSVIKYHFIATTDLAIENRSLGYCGISHLFKAHGLRAKLDPVAIVPFRLPALKFHRTDHPITAQPKEFRRVRSVSHFFDLNHVQASIQLQPQ